MLYPLFLNLRNKKCLVLGGGAVAERKVLTLLKAGAKVTVVSLEFSSGLKRLAKRYKKLQLIVIAKNKIHSKSLRAPKGRGNLASMRLLRRLFKKKAPRNDIQLAFACTSDRRANFEFAKLCNERGVWVNQVDDLKTSDFLVPASFKQGKLQVALSTSGLSPLFARQLKAKIQKAIGKDDIRFLNWLGQKGKRRNVIRQLATPEERQRFFAALLEPNFLRLFRRPEMTRIETHFQRLLKRFQNKGRG